MLRSEIELSQGLVDGVTAHENVAGLLAWAERFIADSREVRDRSIVGKPENDFLGVIIGKILAHGASLLRNAVTIHTEKVRNELHVIDQMRDLMLMQFVITLDSEIMKPVQYHPPLVAYSVTIIQALHDCNHSQEASEALEMGKALARYFGHIDAHNARLLQSHPESVIFNERNGFLSPHDQQMLDRASTLFDSTKMRITIPDVAAHFGWERVQLPSRVASLIRRS